MLFVYVARFVHVNNPLKSEWYKKPTVRKPKMQRAKNKKRRGFSITEVLISMLIFSITAIGFTQAILSSMRTHLMARDYYTGSCLARNRLQRGSIMDYNSLDLLAEDEVRIDADGNADPNGAFERTTVVNQNVAPNCTEISVAVRFPDRVTGLSTTAVEVVSRITEGM